MFDIVPCIYKSICQLIKKHPFKVKKRPFSCQAWNSPNENLLLRNLLIDGLTSIFGFYSFVMVGGNIEWEGNLVLKKGGSSEAGPFLGMRKEFYGAGPPIYGGFNYL